MKLSRLLLMMGGKAPSIPWYLEGSIPAANCVAAYQAYNATSKIAAVVNRANPGTYDLVESGTIAWAVDTGFVIDGSGELFETGITVSETWSYLVRFADNGTKYRYIFGCGTASLANPSLGISPRNDSFTAYNGGIVSSAPEVAADFAGVAGIAGNKHFLDGVARAGTMAAWSGTITETLKLGGIKYGATTAYFAGKIHYFSVYNVVLTDAQVLAVSNAMNALP